MNPVSSPPADFAALLEPPDDFDARPVVARLVAHADRIGASDLHLRPNGTAVEVLARLDGVLARRFDLPLTVYDRILIGLKNMARMASYRKAVPQDGRLLLDGADVRVATTPTHFGEKVVLRFVRAGSNLHTLDTLGLQPREEQQLREVVEQPQGLVLATGPAGSGKTTTLYAIIRHLMSRHRQRLAPMQGATLNVVTLEDPIECILPEITQTPIAVEMGMTFASGLRSMLRQDPEVLLVGEIRDRETATAAVQCGLTGHLVLSTLHARNSVGTIPRLRELGVEPYLLGASLSGAIYQRLLRRLCASCRRASTDTPAQVALRRAAGLPEGPCYEAVGCAACDGTGYQGRSVVAEVLRADDGLRQLILDGAPMARLEEHAGESGMQPLDSAALVRVAQGVTSWDEVDRTCRPVLRQSFG